MQIQKKPNPRYTAGTISILKAKLRKEKTEKKEKEKN